jgi:rhodanese-related sulfurtransferase
MKNIHSKLEQYGAKCDEVLLSSHFREIIQEAQGKIEQLTPSQIDLDDDTIILIDVREPEEFASGYIGGKNVLTIPRGKLEFMAIDKIGKTYGQDVTIITYCLKGPRGSLAAVQLKKMGFENVKNLSGGISQWLTEGYSVKSYLGELKLI